MILLKSFKPEFIKVYVNNVLLEVLADTNYITIDYTGRVEAWRTVPYINEGFWYSNPAAGEVAEVVARVEIEEGDKWTKPFDIHHNDWYDPSYCGGSYV